jgi:hypothetical protein
VLVEAQLLIKTDQTDLIPYLAPSLLPGVVAAVLEQRRDQGVLVGADMA